MELGELRWWSTEVVRDPAHRVAVGHDRPRRASVGAIRTADDHLGVPDGLCVDDPERAVTLLRCTQEIITNAARHARAQNLWIDIVVGDLGAVELTAHDDGDGATDAPPGHGLRGMRERVEETGGRLETSAIAGDGFRIRAVLPARRE